MTELLSQAVALPAGVLKEAEAYAVYLLRDG